MKTKKQLRTKYDVEAQRLYAIHIAVNTDATTDCKTWAYGETFTNASRYLQKHTVKDAIAHFTTCLQSLKQFTIQSELNTEYQNAMEQVLTELKELSEFPKDGAVNR